MAYTGPGVLQTALANHPLWRGPAKQGPQPNILGRTLAGHPSWRGPAGPNNPLNRPGPNDTLTGTTRLPTAPTAAQTAPTNSATTQTPQGPTLDSTALANIAAHQFDVNNQINGINRDSGYAATDLQNALAQLGRQQPLDLLKADQSANSRGALFSTALGQQLGNINQDYLTRQTGAQDTYTRGQTGRDAQISALLGGEPIYNDQQAAAAAQRAANLAATLPPPATPAAAPGATAGSPAGGVRDTLTGVKPLGWGAPATPQGGDTLTGTRNLGQKLAKGWGGPNMRGRKF